MKSIQVQLTINLDETAIQALAEIIKPAIRQAIGLPTSESDEKSDARLRTSRAAIFGGESSHEGRGLLIDSKEAAHLLGVCEKTLWTLHNSGEMPPPIRFGRAVRFRLESLKKWVEAGCPDCRNRTEVSENGL